MSRLSMKLVYLKDVSAEFVKVNRNDTRFFDPEYREWKTAHIGGDSRPFGEWLKAH